MENEPAAFLLQFKMRSTEMKMEMWTGTVITVITRKRHIWGEL